MLFPAVGIVAEYNPFHNGHLHHIERARALSGADAVVCVLSSDFGPRGEPALLDKWSRAEAAVSCGADLVLELPVVWSSHNAGAFANCAVDILAASGVVSSIAFGAETPDCLSDNIINILLEEPDAFKLSLKKHLDLGFSYVESRARAAEEVYPGSSELLKQSNNTLALAYMMRIKQRGYAIRAVPVLRRGAAYNSTELAEISSAAAIRKALRDGSGAAAFAQMPEQSSALLRKRANDGRACVETDKFWKLLRMQLLRSSPEELRTIAEVSEGIEYRMKKAALEARSFEEWKNICTSRRYPAGRVARSAVHILLGLGHWTNRAAQRLSAPYIRPLAMNSAGRALLHEMRARAALPVVTTYGQAARVSGYSAAIAEKEQLACELWEEMIPCGSFGAEHKRKPVII